MSNNFALFNTMQKVLLYILFFALSSFVSVAQESISDSLPCNPLKCYCHNNLSPAGVMISHVHEKNEWMFSYRNMRMTTENVLQGSEIISNEKILNQYTASPNYMTMQMHMLMAMFGITNRLTVMGMAHYNRNYMEMTMKMGDQTHQHPMTTSGFGDTKLIAMFAVVKKENCQLIASTGVNLPFGKTNLKGNSLDMMYPNSHYPYTMQLGSGTIDWLPGFTYTYFSNKFTTSSQIASVIHVANHTTHYTYGNEYRTNVWLAYNFLPVFSSSIRVEGLYVSPIIGKDPSLSIYKEPAANSANYGGKFVQLYFGGKLQFKNNCLAPFQIGAEIGIPVYQWVAGIQMQSKFSLHYCLTYNL